MIVPDNNATVEEQEYDWINNGIIHDTEKNILYEVVRLDIPYVVIEPLPQETVSKRKKIYCCGGRHSLTGARFSVLQGEKVETERIYS